MDTEFIAALEQGHCDVIDTILAQGYTPEPKDINIPCTTGNVDVLTRLLTYFANRTTPELPAELEQGLFLAVSSSHNHLLDHLYLAGVNIGAVDHYNRTSLHHVKDVKTCKWLLDMGCPQTISSGNCTPLSEACYGNLIEIAKLLLSTPSGQEHIGVVGYLGRTCLHIACHNDVELVKLLLSYPQAASIVGLADVYGHTALYLACHNNSLEIAKMLLQYPEAVSTINGYNEYDKSGQVVRKSYCDSTPLHKACHHGNLGLVGLLLSFPEGIETIGQTNSSGQTPLHIACEYGHLKIVELLLQYLQGTQHEINSILVQDRYGKTPMWYARNKPQILTYLKQFFDMKLLNPCD